MYNLTGKVAIVTGSGGRKGIGRAIALRLAGEGADVVITDVGKPPVAAEAASGWQGIESVAREIEALGRSALPLLSDVTSAPDVDDMVSRTLDRFGRIDILVCNAGSRPGPDRRLLIDLGEDAFDEVQRVNVKGTFLCCRAVGRHMVERGGPGRVIVMSSRAGKQGTAKYAAYCASKFALVGLTQAFALEMAPHQVTVNAICPGLVDTERVLHIAEGLHPEGITAEAYAQQMLDERAQAAPLGRAAVADDVANLAAFLASDQSEYMTGLAINVSGGLGMN
jgi:NAD(P)-dependent dehydrogenase (short-subunit alcohol dehydrogenase family)